MFTSNDTETPLCFLHSFLGHSVEQPELPNSCRLPCNNPLTLVNNTTIMLPSLNGLKTAAARPGHHELPDTPQHLTPSDILWGHLATKSREEWSRESRDSLLYMKHRAGRISQPVSLILLR